MQACSLCNIAKGNSFGGPKQQLELPPSTSTAASHKLQESKKQQELLKDKDRQLSKLREQLREAKGQGPEREAQAEPGDPDQQRLASIAASLKMLAASQEPALQAAKIALQEERDSIKTLRAQQAVHGPDAPLHGKDRDACEAERRAAGRSGGAAKEAGAAG